MVAVFGILLVLIALVAFGPALIAVVSQTVAEAFGCQVDLNRVIPCEIGGKDYGQTFYDLGFSIWYSYLSLPRRRARHLGVGVIAPRGQARQIAASARRDNRHSLPSRRSPSPIPPGSLRRIGCDLNEVAEHPCTILGECRTAALPWPSIWFISLTVMADSSRSSCSSSIVRT